MVGPVRIHDREPLHPVILGTGLGDVGDLRIEERAFAREARIDQVRALVPGPAPVALGDLPTALDQLLAQRDVIKVTAHRQAAVAVGADIAVHQHLRAATRPHPEIGRDDLAEARLRQRIGPGRLEQPVILEVGGDHVGQRPAEPGG